MHATADLRDADDWLGIESMLSVPGSHEPAPVAPAEPEPAARASLERGCPAARAVREGPQARD